MRRIRKAAEPPSLANWREAIRPRGAIPPWDTLPGHVGSDMRNALLGEQLKLCCYCTGSIARGNFHIEHFCPRDPGTGNPKLTYVWSNLLASCQGGAIPHLTSTRRHCGEAKGNWFDPLLTISPTETGVESKFRFNLRGKVVPARGLEEDVRRAVDLTITNLNLNAPSLVDRREALISQAATDSRDLDHGAWRAKYLDLHAGALQEFQPALEDLYRRVWGPELGWI